MSCIKYLQNNSLAKLRSRGVLSGLDKISNLDALNNENIALNKIFKQMYDENIDNPVGKVSNGKFKVNRRPNLIEEAYKIEGGKRYKGVTDGLFEIGPNVEIMLTPNDIVDIFNYSEKNIHLKVYQFGELVKSKTSLKDMLILTTNEGFKNLINDIREGINTNYLMATFPAIIYPLQSILDEARKEEAKFNAGAKETSAKIVLEEFLEKEGSTELKAANSFLDDLLEKTNTKYTTTIERESAPEEFGSATVTGLNVGLFNIALRSRSNEVFTQEVNRTFVHEKAHIVTIGLLRLDNAYHNKIKELFNLASKNLKVKDNYGITDIYEFLAEALSNKDFQIELDSIPYKNNSFLKELVDTILKVFSKILGKNVNKGSILHEVLLSTSKAADIAVNTNSKLHTVIFDKKKIFESINNSGKYEGNADAYDVDKWAKSYGFTYDAENKQFYANNKLKTEMNKAALVASMDFDRNSFFYKHMVRETNASSIEEHLDKLEISKVEHLFVQYNVDLDNINGNLADLKTANRTKIIAPNQTEKLIEAGKDEQAGYYIVNSTEYYRVTSYLGGSIDTLTPGEIERISNSGRRTLKENEARLLLNATKLGNVADELSKRIFSEDYDSKDITYEKINEFVKNEAWELDKLDYSNRKDIWDKKYKNPFSKDAFDKLEIALNNVKLDLIKNYDVKTFHSDIIVWDKSKFVAGEIDILAELNDGSFMVIDMKTRRKGDDASYSASFRNNFSTKDKHTRQTNVYTEMLEKMGFSMQAPMIIMAKPVYSDTKVVDNEDIEVLSNGDYATLIPLEKNTDYFNYHVYDEGTKRTIANLELRDNIEGKRENYRKFLNSKRELDSILNQTIFNVDRKKRAEALRLSLTNLESMLTRYETFLNSEKGTKPSKSLLEVRDKIKDELIKVEEEQSFRVQVNIAYDFFQFAEEELKSLLDRLNKITSGEGGDDSTIESQKEAYLKIRNYRGVFATAQNLYSTLEELKEGIDISSQEYDRLSAGYDRFQVLNGRVVSQLRIHSNTLGKDIFKAHYYGSKFEIKMRDILRKEAENIYPKGFVGENGSSRENLIQEFINKKISTKEFKEEVMKKYHEEIDDLTKNIQYDMKDRSFYVNSDVMVNNKYVQLVHNMLSGAEQRFTNIAREELVTLHAKYKELQLSARDLRKLIVKDKSGDSYLISKYDINYLSELKELNNKISEALHLPTKTSAEQLNRKIKHLEATKVKKAWILANSKKDLDTGKIIPTDKWKVDISGFSEKQLIALRLFKQISNKNEERIGLFNNSLITRTNLNGLVYYRLPGVKETTYGAFAKGNFGEGLKRIRDDATKVEIGDTQEGYSVNKDGEVVKLEYTGLDGKPILTNPLFFRGRPKEKQSTDLFSIYAMELQNGIRYSINKDLSIDIQIIMDMIDNTEFYKTINGFKVVSKLSQKGSDLSDIIMGDASVTAKMIRKMGKNRVYSMSQEYAGSFMGIDLNRAMQVVATYTAFSSMSFQYLSATNNWITGIVSKIIEAAGGEFFSFKDLAIAEGVYLQNSLGIMGDAGRPIQTNFVNQLMTHYEIQNEPDILNNRFERRNRFTRFADPGYSLVGYSLGEHQIHATLGMAILQGIKVLDINGNLLNNEGNSKNSDGTDVTRDQAASILDSFSLEDGILKQADWAQFNEHETLVSTKDGGDSVIRTLIKDRVVRTQGAFGAQTKSEIDRLWYGKLFKQFKKHIPPQALNRFRGISNAFVDTVDIEEHDKYYNYNAKTEEYGYYVSFLRYIKQVVTQEKFNILNWAKKGNKVWKAMHKHERANVLKTTTELSFLTFTMILAGMAAAAAAEDDDNEMLWTFAYLLRRQVGDSGAQYFSPPDMWRIADSPFAAIKSLNNTSDFITQLLDPTEKYVSGVHANQNKLYTKFKRVSIIFDAMEQFRPKRNKQKFISIENN